MARETQKCLDEIKKLAHENPESPPKVWVGIGRSGTGKSSFTEDTSGLLGYSQQSLDSVTQRCELAKIMIEDEACFIMDTPGFDPAHAEAIFHEIIQGMKTILATSQISGFLYFTCINQPRFDSFDRQVLQIVRAMSGYDYIPYVTFITTFWTATRLSQQANFNAQLELLRKDCRKTFGVQQLHFYQHGRGYNADGEVTESFLDWFEESGRTQMALNARDMIARYYCSPNASAIQAVTPKIVQELRDGIPIYETDAGRALGLQPTSNEQHREAFDQQSSRSGPYSATESNREANQDAGSQDIPRATQSGLENDEAPGKTWGQVSLEAISWFFRNVNFNIDVAGPRGGITPALGTRYGGTGFGDPRSSVDVMKSVGLDSSKEGRIRYASQHGIGGQPFSAPWGEAIRKHVLQNHGR